MYTSRDEAEVADTRGSALATGFGTRADRYLALALKSTLGLIATRAGLLGRLSDLALLLLASHTVPDCGQRSAVLVFGVSHTHPLSRVTRALSVKERPRAERSEQKVWRSTNVLCTPPREFTHGQLSIIANLATFVKQPAFKGLYTLIVG